MIANGMLAGLLLCLSIRGVVVRLCLSIRGSGGVVVGLVILQPTSRMQMANGMVSIDRSMGSGAVGVFGFWLQLPNSSMPRIGQGVEFLMASIMMRHVWNVHNVLRMIFSDIVSSNTVEGLVHYTLMGWPAYWNVHDRYDRLSAFWTSSVSIKDVVGALRT